MNYPNAEEQQETLNKAREIANWLGGDVNDEFQSSVVKIIYGMMLKIQSLEEKIKHDQD